MKKRISRVIEILVFICLLLVITSKLSLFIVVYGKGLDNNRNSRLFYELPKNTVDILFLGDSHVYHSFIPQKIFDDKGYTSSIIATSNQSIINSYWIIKEALFRQKPSLIVMDLHSIEDTMRKSDDYLHFTSGVLSIPDFSKNKYFCLKDLQNSGYGICDDITFNDVVGFLQFREDYERKGSLIEFVNIAFCPEKEYKTFGYYPITEIQKIDKINPGSDETNKSFKETIAFKYLIKIKELCDSEGIQLLLTRNLYSSSSGNIKAYEELFSWAKEKGVHTIDYFELIDTVDFDLNTDFCNMTHLNYNGAKKATSYLINYISENYSLIDHRGDSRYSLWENNAYDYQKIELEMKNEIEKNKD